MGIVQNFLKARYGCNCTSVEAVVVLNAVAPVPVLLNNPNRLGWTIFNLGAAIGYVGFSADVTALNGIQLAAAGGMASITATDDGELPARALWGLGAAATTLYIVSTEGMES